ncbi:Protein dachsous [Hypsibius exemplaris]|uniref:Protein dachsous n=1 Tax=Hypsibius exemplaris TaxID=2072580 RepID=A0A1W0WCP6_HYPEX|nr:Protein dachsous [Hypsibius exemplaris]
MRRAALIVNVVKGPNSVSRFPPYEKLSRLAEVRADGSGCSSSGKIHYSKHPSWTDEYFQINSETGEICLLRSLDNVRTPVRQLVIQATDKSNASTTAFVQLHLPPITVFRSRYFVTDIFHTGLHNAAPTGTPVVQLKPEEETEDACGWRFVYSITGGNDNQLFQVDPRTGLISVSSSVRDHVGLHRLLVTVQEVSGKGQPDMAVVVVAQLQVFVKVDTQEAYFAAKIFKFTLGEDASIGATAGSLQVLPQHSTVKFLIQPPGSTAFEVDADSGLVRTKTGLDRDAKGWYVFNVIAQYPDAVGQDTAQVMITVGDMDDNVPLFRTAEVALHVPEGGTTGDAIFQASALDGDGRYRRPLHYTLTSQASQEHFHLDQSSGLLTIAKPLDYETASAHQLSIHAIELGAPFPTHATLLVKVLVIDRNDHSPIFENSTYQVTVAEDSVVGTVLLKVKANDADSGKSGRVTYQLSTTSDEASIFGVYPQTGEIYLRQELDREQRDSYIFHIQASDHGRPQFKSLTTIKVFITDVNDNEPVFSSVHYNFTIYENAAAGAFVGKVVATDKDAGVYGQVSFQLLCNESYFEISSNTGEIFSKKTLDREELSSYGCTVTATDSVFATVATLTVTVLDVNDNAPVFTLPIEPVVWITEGEPEGTEVLRVSATDADDRDFGRITYALNSDEDSYAFSIHPATGTVRSRVVLDHEKQSLFRLMVIASDRGEPARTAQRAITVHVVDLNDNRPTFSSNVVTIEIVEGTSAGVEIGTVLAVDADSGENGRVSYSIIRGNVFGAFDIGRTSGKIYTAREVDYELAPSYMLRVRAVDSSSVKPRSNLLVVNIIVIDINDSAPKFTTDTCLFSVKENIALGTTVWNFTASDADSGSFGQVTYDISYQFPQTAFKIHPVTGALSVAERIDYERHKNYSLVVTASDKDPERTKRKSASLKCLVVVQDENDYAPKFVSRNIVKITENVPDGYPVTQMVALDEDSYSNGNVSYEITRGNEEKVFALDALTGLISLNRPSSLLKTKAYSLTIVATDNGTPRLATMQSVTIEIDSISNKIQVFNQSVYEVNLSEDADAGTVVLRFDTSAMFNNSIRFSIPEEFLYEAFTLDTGTGELRVIRGLDRETKDHYFMNIYATNKQNPLLYDFATIVIEILDVNDNSPTFQDSCHGLTIPENNEFGPVHKFVAVDRDLEENAKITYRIESGNADQKFFINPQNGEMSAKPLDREEQDEYTLLVVAEDHGRPSKQSVCRIRVAVVDRNDNIPVFNRQSYSVHVSEDVPVGHTVVQVQATDKDIGENSRITYQLRNDTRSLLHINEITGVVNTANILDREVITEYVVEVIASDGTTARSQTAKVLLTILIDDVNDNQPEFSRFRYESKISTTLRIGQPVAKVVATDKDLGQNSQVMYGFATPQDKFNINSDTGLITAKEDIRADGQPGSLYRMKVVATDQGKDVQKSSLGMLDIMVGDAPGDADVLKFSQSLYKGMVPENSRVGTKVQTVSAVWSDGRTTKVYYSIVDGNVGDIFELDKTSGNLTVRHNTDLDFEKHKKFNLTVLAETDEAVKTQAYASVVISVGDENDNAPHFSQNRYVSSVWEGNNKGTYVTQVLANDPDSGRYGELTYDIIDGNSDNAFIIDPPFSGIVKTNMVLDREIVESYKLTIVARDNGKPRRSASCTLKITIIDVNDNQPVFPHYHTVTVSEGAALGSVIFAVAANDVDANTEMAYSMPGSANKTFTVNPQNGNIAVATPLDREKQSRYILTIQASDKVHTTRTNLTVIVKDENDNAPVFSKAKYEVSVAEMTPAGTAILTLPATDADEGENGRIRYTIRIAPVSGFAINEQTGVITTTKPVVFEPNNPPLILAVSAEDHGSPKLSSLAEVQIRVTGVNRHAPVFKRTMYSVHVPEDVQLGQKLLQVSAHDPDAERGSSSVKYSLSGGDPDAVFQIDSRTGALIVVKKLDRESAATYTLHVAAADHGKPSRTATAEVIVDVDDVNDNAPVWNQTEYKAFVDEGLKRGSPVLQVKAVDFDAGENATVAYAILTGNEAGLFRINAVTGLVEVNGELDYETTSEYKLIVQATDSGRVKNQSAITEVMIYLTDANDNAPYFAVNLYKESIAENSPAGTVIFTARAHDKDKGSHGKLRYSITSSEVMDEFEVEPDTGKVSSKVVLDYETKETYNFVVTATDNGGSRADVQVTVDINSRDEFPPKFSQNGYRFFTSPESKKDDVVGQVAAADEDTGVDGAVVFRFQNPSEVLTINSSTGVISLLIDFHVENTTKPRPEISTLVIADSAKEGSKSDAALVTVIFGLPDPSDLTNGYADAWQTNGSLILGCLVGSLFLITILAVTGVFCVRSHRAKTSRRQQHLQNRSHHQQYSDSFDVLQYAPFRGLGIDNAASQHHHHHSHPSNHYHDPAAGSRSDASVSSGRGSATDDGVMITHLDGGHGHYYTDKKSSSSRRGGFPQTMPDSGLPDMDMSTGEYFHKVPIPVSAPGSHESIHRFDDEAGGEEKYFHQCQGNGSDQERRSHGSSSNSSVFERPSRRPTFKPTLQHPSSGNDKFDYLMWVPEYAPMAAVYAEIAEFPGHPSERSSESQSQNPYSLDGGGSQAGSVQFFSKSSSQTTLPSIPPHLMLQRNQYPPGRGNGQDAYQQQHHLNAYARK